MAALTSRSCWAPQAPQLHCLTDSCCFPVGPVRAPQVEQPLVEFLLLTSMTRHPPGRLLAWSIVMSWPIAAEPAGNHDQI